MTSFERTFDTRMMMGSNEREVNPPRAVEIIDDRGDWRPGILDRWTREGDGWHGRVKDPLGLTRWYHQDSIREG